MVSTRDLRSSSPTLMLNKHPAHRHHAEGHRPDDRQEGIGRREGRKPGAADGFKQKEIDDQAAEHFHKPGQRAGIPQPRDGEGLPPFHRAGGQLPFGPAPEIPGRLNEQEHPQGHGGAEPQPEGAQGNGDDEQVVQNAVDREARDARGHGQLPAVFQRKEGEQLLAHQQGRDPERLAVNVIVQQRQVRLHAHEHGRRFRDGAQRQRRGDQHAHGAGKEQVQGEQAADLLPVPGQVPAVEHLRPAHHHDAGRVQEMIERAEQPDGAHGGLADGVAGVQAVHDAVDRADHDQQHLVRQQPEKQPRQQFIFG